MTQPRYAIYYAPATTDPLWHFGSGVLGYDAQSGTDLPRRLPELSGKPWHEVTSDPRKYGFHATLKAPFHLREGRSERELMAAVGDFAAQTIAVKTPDLCVKTLGPFIALAFAAPSQAVQDLAASVTRYFEPYRAPLTAADRNRRLQSPLTATQIKYLDLYGYPYVFEEFRFHMTLTGPMHPEERAEALQLLTQAYAEQVSVPYVTLRDLALFKQPSPTERFRIIARAPLKIGTVEALV
ncbi:DUF1045 domain-containing protein [Methylovirgula sp. 4M-Z18]|uniref:DUF1045 domain-containing protein n=1 Tax=Methylovirgula sp. 4M-Z18 TaxID=2293567 RepID=UPI000E2F15B3|nr:DUF1045 domain-containing protein [Methylovirgula sp. 4M-Z18]RFB81255.1 DUF1045 domain-containing protein [Methylovirgula sp. 4M-Z18]